MEPKKPTIFDKYRPSLYKKSFKEVVMTEPDFWDKVGVPNIEPPAENFWTKFEQIGFPKEVAVRLLGFKVSDILHIQRNPMEYMCFQMLYNVSYVFDISIELAFMYCLKFGKTNRLYRQQSIRHWKENEHRNILIEKPETKSLMERYGVKDLDELLSRQDLIRELSKNAKKKPKMWKNLEIARSKKDQSLKVKDILPGLYKR